MARNIKELKNGKISIKLTKKVQGLLTNLVEFRIDTTDDELRTELLKILHRKLTECDGRIRLTKVELICLGEGVPLLHESNQALIFASINPNQKPIRLK